MEHEKKHAMLDKFILTKTLGSGYHAKVKLGYNTEDGKYFAIKIFKNTHSIQSNLKTLKAEIEIMQKLKHPNLVNLIAFHEQIDYVKKNGQTYKCMAIVLEFAAGGELFEYVANTGRFSEVVARTYFHQMIAGLEYLHKEGIAHRDMKPENLLFADDFTLKIADFGFATLLEGKYGDAKLRTVLGTESYMAPEIHAKQPYSGASVDLFAASIILFIMYSGTPPFTKADPKDPYYRLLCTNRHDVFWNAHQKHKPQGFVFSDNFKNFMNALLAQDPHQRPSLAEIKSHPWFVGQILTPQQLRQEFDQRKLKVDGELEKARIQKMIERQQKNNQNQGNLFHTGVGNFRSVEQIKDEFSGLAEKYNLNVEREMKAYDAKGGKLNDFFTIIDAPYLFRYLLNNKESFITDLEKEEEEEEQDEQKQEKIEDEKPEKFEHYTIETDPKTYKLKFTKKDVNNETKVVFQVTMERASEEKICVEFRKIQGDSFEYNSIINVIKEKINELQLIKEKSNVY